MPTIGEFKELLKQPNLDLEKETTISSDGRTFLTRIPKEIIQFLKIKKGHKIRWTLCPRTKNLSIKLIKND